MSSARDLSRVKPLSNYQLDGKLKKLVPCYAGTFDKDSLPDLTGKKPCCIILNTELDTTSTVGHWVAVVVDNHRNVHYFDSYGDPPKFISWRIYLKKLDKNNYFTHSSASIQPPDTNICGHLCIEFIVKRLSVSHRMLSDTAVAKSIDIYKAVEKYYNQ